MRPSSKYFGRRSVSSFAARSMACTRGRTSSLAKAATASRNARSSSEKTVSGGCAGAMVIDAVGLKGVKNVARMLRPVRLVGAPAPVPAPEHLEGELHLAERRGNLNALHRVANTVEHLAADRDALGHGVL